MERSLVPADPSTDNQANWLLHSPPLTGSEQGGGGRPAGFQPFGIKGELRVNLFFSHLIRLIGAVASFRQGNRPPRFFSLVIHQVSALAVTLKFILSKT